MSAQRRTSTVPPGCATSGGWAWGATAASVALAAVTVPSSSAAQSLAGRVAAAPDGYVRFQYEARPGVCGDGRYISVDGDHRIRWRSDDEACDCVCEEGPIRVELRVSGGVVQDLDAEVGGGWESRSGAVTDLGDVPPRAAADYLLGLAQTSSTRAGERAIFPATIARGVEAWPRLLEIARTDGVRRKTRRQAVFWLGQEASDRATEGLESIIENEDELEVREAAVFALSQRHEEAALEALLRIAREGQDPELRKKAIFWLGQRGDEPRVLALFEELLTRSP